MTPGEKLREAILAEHPLQIVGVINAYVAKLAEQVGFRALYLSGAGVANASYGLPDTGITDAEDVLIDVLRISQSTELPLLVDIDTGWEEGLGIEATIISMERAGAAGVQIEDQLPAKRCGHLPGKQLVSAEEMVKRLKFALSSKTDPNFVIMARTDAFLVEGLESAIERAKQYVAAGADMIFAESFKDLDDYKQLSDAIEVPVLANMTEFGQTPLYSLEELKQAKVDMVLYPLSAFRAMNQAALKVYQSIRKNGDQQQVIDQMQTRDELYQFLDYNIAEAED